MSDKSTAAGGFVMPSIDSGWLDVTAAARRVGLRPTTLNQYRCYEGMGPEFTKFLGRVWYRAEDLDAWMASRGRGGSDGRGE